MANLGGFPPWAPERVVSTRVLLAHLLAILILGALGCTGVHRPPGEAAPTFEHAVAVPPGAGTAGTASPEGARAEEGDSPQGVFHRVEAGQTLWRIARAYALPQEELRRVNGLDDSARLEVGQELFIPGATAVLEVPPYPSPLPLVPIPAPRAFAPSTRDAGFEWPVAGGRVVSYFGARRRTHRHAGVDIAGDRGQVILAARAGTVTFSGRTRTGYGNLVILDHGNGIETLYAHDQDLLVRIGDTVEKGQPVAHLGRSGNATTPHCHFEIRKDRVPVDPLLYISRVAEARP
jgi:murein DD-endopeptidase MepM/ murein hydrolase activator NlpD